MHDAEYFIIVKSMKLVYSCLHEMSAIYIIIIIIEQIIIIVNIKQHGFRYNYVVLY